MTFVAALTAPEQAARTLADAIGEDERLSTLSIAIDETGSGDWQVAVYFAARPANSAVARLNRIARTVPGAEGRLFAVSGLADVDWVAASLAALGPVRAGRFLVHGRHDRDKVRANDIGIEIEAGLAFGTGHHGTTAGCLTAIDRLAKRRRIVNALDLGAGSGVLAIAIAKRTGAHVTASDIDPVAVAIARDNARLNGVAGMVTAVTASGFAARAIRERAPYDLIVANILAGPLVAFAPAIRRHLAPGGTVILSGLIASQARRVAAIYRGQGLVAGGAITIGEWATLTMRG
jgi:ribosomal protein L11 methyltransferase